MTSLGGAGRGGGTRNSSLRPAKPWPFQSSREPRPWGWLTLDGSLTLSGPQFPPYVKAGVELGNCKVLLSTSTRHGSGTGRKQMAHCLMGQSRAFTKVWAAYQGDPGHRWGHKHSCP